MKNRSLLLAIILILLGLLFLARNLGFRLPAVFDLERIWPVFIIIGGVVELLTYVSRRHRNPGRLFGGLYALGLGAFFLLFTLRLRLPVLGRVEWRRMGELWPGFILIAGLAYLGQFVLSGFRYRRALAPGILTLLLGAVALAFTQGLLSLVLAQQWAVYWPVILILVGLGMVVRTILRRR